MTGARTIAGVGCRAGCSAEAIVAVVLAAGLRVGRDIDAIAAPDFKRHEPGLHAAAAALCRPLVFVDQAGLAAVQPRCVTRSSAAERATGHASIAEAAALAASGGALLLARIGRGPATCAIAGEAA